MDGHQPLVSVGMPVYNGGRWLHRTLDSLLGQTFKDFELIISDNASTDDTQAICHAYAARDPRIRYIRQPKNIGICSNYNAVFAHSRGIYFKWASSNDICQPTFLEACVAVLEVRPDVVLCLPKTRLIGEDDRHIEDYVDHMDLQEDRASIRFERLLDRLALNNACNALVRSETLRLVGEVGTYTGSDIAQLAALALCGKFCEVPDYLFYRRIGPETQVALRKTEEVASYVKIEQEFVVFKRFAGYFRGAFRAPLPMREKMAVIKIIMRRLIWARHDLALDLWTNTVQRVIARSILCKPGAT